MTTPSTTVRSTFFWEWQLSLHECSALGEVGSSDYLVLHPVEESSEGSRLTFRSSTTNSWHSARVPRVLEKFTPQCHPGGLRRKLQLRVQIERLACHPGCLPAACSWEELFPSILSKPSAILLNHFWSCLQSERKKIQHRIENCVTLSVSFENLRIWKVPSAETLLL